MPMNAINYNRPLYSYSKGTKKYSTITTAVLVTHLGFASVKIGLDKNFAERCIFTHITQSWFHRLTSPQDTHSADLTKPTTTTLLTVIQL